MNNNHEISNVLCTTKRFSHVLFLFRQLVKIHALKCLIIGIMCFIVADNNYLRAQNAKEGISITSTNENDLIKVLVENICDLLQQGHSPDEIAALFNDDPENLHLIQIFVDKIHQLLNEYQSKEIVINIILHNKESESFRKKFKNYYFVLKVIFTIGLIIALSYTAYHFKDWLSDMLSNLLPDWLKRNQPARNNNSRNRNNSNNNTRQPNRQQISETSDNINSSIQNNSVQNTQEFSPQLPNHSNTIDQSNQTAYGPSGISYGSENQDQINQRWEGLVIAHKLDTRLDELITQQIEHARRIGLNPELVPEDRENFTPMEPRANIRLNEFVATHFNTLITAQIEYARSIGLIPPELSSNNT